MTNHMRERIKCLEALGLTDPVSESDIKRAYRNLAQQVHPDKNKSKDATEKFQTIQQPTNTSPMVQKSWIQTFLEQMGAGPLHNVSMAVHRLQQYVFE